MAEVHELDIPTAYAVLELPSAALEVTITAKVYLDGKIQDVQTIYDFDAVRTALKEAEDYFPPDATFYLSEKGKAEADKIIARERERLNDEV